jgi:hypothetical protein
MNLKKIDLKNWGLWRVMRLVLGIIISITGIITLDFILIAAGIFLLVQAWINTCVSCVTGSCDIPKTKLIQKK